MLEKFVERTFPEGANITGGEGGATSLICIKSRGGKDHEIDEVDQNGALVIADKRYQRIYLTDHQKNGVELFLGGNNNPVLLPGQSMDVKVGRHTVNVEGTDRKGVIFNGNKPGRYTLQLGRQLFPNIK